MPDSNIQAHMDAAVQFLQLVIGGRFDEAYRQRWLDTRARYRRR